MEEYYDFCQRAFCIFFCILENGMRMRLFPTGIREGQLLQRKLVDISSSILYDIQSELILQYGTEADENRQSAETNHSIFYVNNGAEIILRNLNRSYSQFFINSKLNKSNSDCDFLFVVPTRWNDGIKEDLLRPLYIRAGLIQKQDHPDRLLFSSQLDLDFCYLQYLDYVPSARMNTKIRNGRHYILYAFNFSNTHLSITLDLFSAQYPPGLTTKGKYVPRVLNSVYFTVPLPSYVQESHIDWDSMDQPSSLNTINNDEWDQSGSDELVDDDRSIDTQESVNSELMKTEGVYKKTLMSIQTQLLRETQNLAKYNSGTKYTAIVITNLGEYVEENCNLFHSSIHWIKKISEDLFGSTSMTFGRYADLYHQVRDLNAFNGGNQVLGKYVEKSNSTRPPLIITENIKSHKALSASLFKHLKPNCIINIDVLSKEIMFNCAVLKSSGETEMLTDYNECGICPLDTFFQQSSIYAKPVLQLTKRFVSFMETNFKDVMDISFNHDEQTIRDNCNMYAIKELKTPPSIRTRLKTFAKKQFRSKKRVQINTSQQLNRKTYTAAMKDASLQIDSYVAKGVLDEFFACKKQRNRLLIKDEPFLLVRQKKYIHLFLIMYFAYLNKLINEKLPTILGNQWKNRNIGYNVFIEKVLLENVFGSIKENFLIESSLLFNTDDFKKVRFSTRGEGILPSIQNKLNLELPLQTYFVTAQLHLSYIQVTLHKVVRVTSLSEYASTIIVRDKVLQIENVVDSICKYIWEHTKSNGITNRCSSMDMAECSQCDIFSLKKLSDVMEKLKAYISEIFASSRNELIMDEQKCVKISRTCECHIQMSLRDTIDIGIKPAIQKLTDTVAASLVSTKLFGNYEIDHAFIFEELFGLPYDTPLGMAYIKVVQESLDNSIELKEKDTQGYFLKESVYQILKPIKGTKPYMYDTFIKGDLQQVSSKTYALYVKPNIPEECGHVSLTWKHLKDGTTVTVKRDGSAIIIIEKGQRIPNTGVFVHFDIEVKKNPPYDFTDGDIELRMIRITSAVNTALDQSVRLDAISYDELTSFTFNYRGHIPPVTLKIDPVSFNSSLYFSIDSTFCVEYELFDLIPDVTSEERLTLAYF
ncbi:uncharacterized protein EV154DRAFT_532463 [Mucor mucedo]|uniref:uncharacterized protein n=1 Tax=Mucor mucedo TaxID=29922 RepID=UPI00222002E5|nr:uncharacterized protein EV154DRAFT_532463 [Mucor mucedo]KAI7866798.1 hypothetical protein EV154DRAFT_532463 [Mucor mucedo]